MSAIFAVDSSCMIPAVNPRLPNHMVAADEIDRRLSRGERMAVSTQALIETYSVLTRLPGSYRVSPRDAWSVIHTNFVERRIVIALDRNASVEALSDLAREGIGGGRTYDAIIAAAAVQAKATVLLTFNIRDFEPPLPGLTIVQPS